jgi:hypothetical protein
MNDYEHYDDDDYNAAYLKYLRNRAEEYPDETDREEFFKELQSITYDPTDNPRQDAELNYRRAKDRLRQKRKAERLPEAAQSFVKFKMNHDGMSEADAKKWVRKTLKGGE